MASSAVARGSGGGADGVKEAEGEDALATAEAAAEAAAAFVAAANAASKASAGVLPAPSTEETLAPAAIRSSATFALPPSAAACSGARDPVASEERSLTIEQGLFASSKRRSSHSTPSALPAAPRTWSRGQPRGLFSACRRRAAEPPPAEEEASKRASAMAKTSSLEIAWEEEEGDTGLLSPWSLPAAAAATAAALAVEQDLETGNNSASPSGVSPRLFLSLSSSEEEPPTAFRNTLASSTSPDLAARCSGVSSPVPSGAPGHAFAVATRNSTASLALPATA